MPTLSDIREIIDNGIPFVGNRLKISTKDYTTISDFLNNITSIVSAIEISNKTMEIFEKKPDWQWVFGFVKQELLNIRKCMRYKAKKLLRKGEMRTQKTVCADISIHLSNLETHYPQIEGIAMGDDEVKKLLEELIEVKPKPQSSSTSSDNKTNFWTSL